MKHCSSLANDPDCLRGLHGLVRERLRDLGINMTRPSKAKKTVFPATPGKKTPSMIPKSHVTVPQNVFGRPLRDLAPSSMVIEEEDGGCSSHLTVPHFLVAILAYLRSHLDTDGLFRKAGSAGRQRSLRVEIEEAETFFVSQAENAISPLDVGSLLKQWLRELPEPLLPTRFHDSFLKCCKLTGEDAQTRAILTTCLLLPPLHACVLTCLVRFLSEVSEASNLNKMDSRSLAIVFTPSLFPVSDGATNIKNVESTNADLVNKLHIMETLIKNSKMVCLIEPKLEEALNIQTLFPTSEDNLDNSDDEDFDIYGAAGPSARRRKTKKKRRSGSLSRVFTATMKGLHKAIRSTTPAGIRSSQGGEISINSIPYPAHTPTFQSPRLPVKRKVSTEHELSPNSKHRKAALESSFTPKVVSRARSVSIKNRFKRKKSLTDGAKFKEPTGRGVSHFDGNAPKTPLPNKTSISSITTNTPGTPASLETGMPVSGQDLSTDNLEDMDVVDHCGSKRKSRRSLEKKSASPAASTTSSRASLASMDSVASSKSYPGRGVVKRQSSERRYNGKPRSPSERKIGIVRRRSQDMAHKKTLIRDDQKKLNTLPILKLDESLLKTHLRRGQPNTFRIKPSPMKVEKAGANGKKTTRIKISFRDGQIQEPRVHIKNSSNSDRNNSVINAEDAGTGNKSKNVNESLTNLRQDISSMIEQSFGPFQDPEEQEVSFGKLTLQDENNDTFTMSELTMPKIMSMRRQSSAFEIQSKFPNFKSNVRRQSSAFELAALKISPESKKTTNFNRDVATRASLKHRNSSVKDLVKKLEVVKLPASEQQQNSEVSYKRMSISTSALPRPANFATPALMLPSPPKETPKVQHRGRPRTRTPQQEVISPSEVEEAKDDFPAGNGGGEWMDANDFFNNPAPAMASRFAQLAFEEASGCKRSSIIRIRTEKKGLVSRSVETFTKPALPPPMMTPRMRRPPAKTPASAIPTSTRRTSARMGIAGKTHQNGPRRQTLTGIRTTAMPTAASEAVKRASVATAARSPALTISTAKEEPIYGNIECKIAAEKPRIASKPAAIYENLPKTPTTSRTFRTTTTTPKGQETRRSGTPSSRQHQRKSKRIEGRRHMTIGYDGEVRCPLKERQTNTIVATVQRSKSAQTPSNKTKINKKTAIGDDLSIQQQKENEVIFNNVNANLVQRSKSLRSPLPNIVVPACLKETIYDITTPKSEKVKRQLSDRVMTPKGGRHEAAPYIRAVLSTSRTPHRGNSLLRTKLMLSNGHNGGVRKSPRLQ